MRSYLRRPRLLLPLAALIVIALAATVVISRDEKDPTGWPDPSATTTRRDVEVVEEFGVCESPLRLARADQRLWVTCGGDLAVISVDPDTGEVASRAGFATQPLGITAGRGVMWVGFADGSEVRAVDVTSGLETGDVVEIGLTPQSLITGLGSVWVSSLNGSLVARIDPATGEIQDRIESPFRFPSGLALGFDRLWVTDVVANLIVSLDPEDTESFRAERTGDSPTSLAIGRDAVWVANFGDGTVARVDPSSLEITGRIVTGAVTADVTVTGNYLWVSDQAGNRVIVYDVTTGDEVGRAELPGSPQGLLPVSEGVYVTIQDQDLVVRLRLGSPVVSETDG